MKNENGATIIQSLDRGLKLLEEIGRSKISVSLKDLASVLGIDRSSIFRLLSTLESRGYLERDEETKRYKLGYKILELSGRLYANFQISELARPYLEELARRTGESAHLAIYSSSGALLIEKENSSEAISVNMDIGRGEPLYCTALGKVLLLSLSQEKLNSIISAGVGSVRGEIKSYTKNTIVDSRMLVEELEKVRQKGYAIDNEEYREGVRCVASPVYDFRGKIVAAIGISGPGSRITLEKDEEIGAAVKGIAEKFSLQLGYSDLR